MYSPHYEFVILVVRCIEFWVDLTISELSPYHCWILLTSSAFRPSIMNCRMVRTLHPADRINLYHSEASLPPALGESIYTFYYIYLLLFDIPSTIRPVWAIFQTLDVSYLPTKAELWVVTQISRLFPKACFNHLFIAVRSAKVIGTDKLNIRFLNRSCWRFVPYFRRTVA